MTFEERNAAMATAGLAVTAIGALLPWSRIGGRTRSGFSTADTFIALADGVLPDAIAWIGRWWYLPAALGLIAWATVFAAGRRSLRIIGPLFITAALVMWWLFVWAGRNWGVIDTRLLGPIVASVGLLVVAWCTTRPRRSLLANEKDATDLAAG